MLVIRGDDERLPEEDLLTLARRHTVTLLELRSVPGVPIEARALGQALKDVVGHTLCIYPVNTGSKGCVKRPNGY